MWPRRSPVQVRPTTPFFDSPPIQPSDSGVFYFYAKPLVVKGFAKTPPSRRFLRREPSPGGRARKINEKRPKFSGRLEQATSPRRSRRIDLMKSTPPRYSCFSSFWNFCFTFASVSSFLSREQMLLSGICKSDIQCQNCKEFLPPVCKTRWTFAAGSCIFSMDGGGDHLIVYGLNPSENGCLVFINTSNTFKFISNLIPRFFCNNTTSNSSIFATR